MKIVFCLYGQPYSREFLLSWSDLLIQSTSRGHQVMLSQISDSRTLCLGGDPLKGADQKPFQGNVDYDAIMWIGSNAVFKSDDFFNLLDSPHDVTAGVYMNDTMTYDTIKEWNNDMFKKFGAFKYMKPEDTEGAPQYIPVAYSGLNWMLLRKGAIEDLKYPWFTSKTENVDGLVQVFSEEMAFCKALEEAGHKVHIDTKIRVGNQKNLII